jgi:hypothetical protein
MNRTQTVTPLRHYLEIQVPEGESDFATAYKPLAEAEANWERVLESERARLKTPQGQSPFADPNAVPEPDSKLNERVELENELFDATVERYRESFGDLNGEHRVMERESTPCHENKYGFCSGWHTIAGFGIALFAQTESYVLNSSVKKAENGEFENVACYYGATVLLVHGSPTTEQIRGRYRLNDHTVLVVEGVDEWFFGLDKPKDITGKVREDLRTLPLEKLPVDTEPGNSPMTGST